MKKFITLITPLALLTSCIVQNSEYFSSLEHSEDKNYGYTAYQPVAIKNGSLERSIESSYYFLSRLRTENGDSLRLVGRASVGNPNYKSTGLKNRYTGKPMGGGGILLDRYVLTPASSSADTIVIFINPYSKGEVMIPEGLEFEAP